MQRCLAQLALAQRRQSIHGMPHLEGSSKRASAITILADFQQGFRYAAVSSAQQRLHDAPLVALWPEVNALFLQSLVKHVEPFLAVLTDAVPAKSTEAPLSGVPVGARGTELPHSHAPPSHATLNTCACKHTIETVCGPWGQRLSSPR